MRPRIRILVFSTLYPSSARPHHGIFVEARLKRLLASGEVDARVVAPVPWFPSRHPRFGAWASFAATPRSETWNGIQVRHPRYPLPPKIGMSIAPLLLALGAGPTVARLIEEEGGFDLIDAHYYYPDGAAAALLAGWFRKPFVVTGRGSDLNLLPAYRIPQQWIRWTETRARCSILVSGALVERLMALGGDRRRMRLLRNGVDLELFKPGSRDAASVKLGLEPGRWLVSVGTLVESKGHHIAIEALKLLPDDIRLAVIGDGDGRARLEALAQKLALTERVRILGAQPQTALVDWYNAAYALVLCSAREGIPNVVLEALACGTPIVATAVGGLPEVVSSEIAGRLIGDRKADVLASAVLELLSSPPSKEAVRTFASAFTWEETTRGQLELFRAVSAGSA